MQNDERLNGRFGFGLFPTKSDALSSSRFDRQKAPFRLLFSPVVFSCGFARKARRRGASICFPCKRAKLDTSRRDVNDGSFPRLRSKHIECEQREHISNANGVSVYRIARQGNISSCALRNQKRPFFHGRFRFSFFSLRLFPCWRVRSRGRRSVWRRTRACRRVFYPCKARVPP